MRFSRVVAWGHPLHSNTFSYIHSTFLKAFKSLGYETHWLTNDSDVSNIDFSNSLFFTEGQVDAKIPLRHDCRYVLHNCRFDRYPVGCFLKLQTYYQNDPLTVEMQYAGEKLGPGVFYNNKQNMLYQSWGTDLLPHEIDLDFVNKPRQKICHWVGTIGGQLYGNEKELAPFQKACSDNGVEFKHHPPNTTSIEDSFRLVQESCIAPAIHGTYQSMYGYVACRVFKNISYGHMGVTNCRAAQELFDGQLIFNSNTYQLFSDAQAAINDKDRVRKLMVFVKDKHTYLNRIDNILKVLP